MSRKNILNTWFCTVNPPMVTVSCTMDPFTSPEPYKILVLAVDTRFVDEADASKRAVSTSQLRQEVSATHKSDEPVSRTTLNR